MWGSGFVLMQRRVSFVSIMGTIVGKMVSLLWHLGLNPLTLPIGS